MSVMTVIRINIENKNWDIRVSCKKFTEILYHWKHIIDFTLAAVVCTVQATQ